MKLKAIDAAIVTFIVLAALITVAIFLAVKGPAVDVQGVTIQEIPDAPHQAKPSI